jgi:glycerol-3-phosphate dehydrogenase (NAD(P)+)
VKATVLGAGSWGTTFAKLLIDAGNDVTLWARRPELAEQVNNAHENSEYLPGIVLPPSLRATHEPAAALADAELVAFAVPSQTLRANLQSWRDLLPADATLVSLMKGVELGTTKRMSEVIVEVAGASADRVAIVTGPNLAPEIAQEQPTATVIACVDEDRARSVQAACAANYVRPYTNSDVVGCELGGAVKNVIALACGIGQGMGFGHNSLASLMTRGLAETARLGMQLGANPITFSGLAGMGDLIASCSSPVARNRSFGERLGHGDTLEQAQLATHGQVAEGVQSCRAVLELAQLHKVDVPITQAVEAVCFRGLTPAAMLDMLMSRSVKSEAR